MIYSKMYQTITWQSNYEGNIYNFAVDIVPGYKEFCNNNSNFVEDWK